MQPLFTVYRSSAGSGKTETLVREFLCLALGQPSPLHFSRILAITFTNKAADEMRDRVIGRVYALAHLDDDKTRELLTWMEEQIREDRLIIRKRAADALTCMLHHYHRLHISTIDRFVYSVIRAFSDELNIGHDAEIVSDNDRIIAEVVNQLLEKTGVDPEYTRLLTRFMAWRQEEGASWNPEKELREFGKQIFSEESREPLRALSAVTHETYMQVRENLQKQIITFENEVVAIAGGAIAYCDAHGLTHDDFHQKSRGFLAFLVKVKNLQWEGTEFKQPVVQFVAGEACFHSSVKGARLDRLAALYTELQEAGLKIMQLYTEKWSSYVFSREVFNRMFSLSLLTSIYKIKETWLQERDAVLLSDFHRIVADVVSHEPAPFIYERTGERLHHFFIDEFQDTSRLQWGNLLPLLENGLASGYKSLVVGDAKQSIYRWRNGKVEQFLALPDLPDFEGEIWHERQQVLQRNYHQEVLDYNWRSGDRIVEFNNVLFESLSAELEKGDTRNLYADAYKGKLLLQKSPANKSGGYVEVNYWKENKEEDRKTSETKEEKAELAYNHIQQCIGDGYSPGEICLLVRTNAEADLLSRFLVKRHLKVASGNAMLLKNFPEIHLLIGGLRAMLARRSESDLALFMVDYLRYIKAVEPLHVLETYVQIRNERKFYRFYDFLKDYDLYISSAEIRNMTFYELVVRFAGLLKLEMNSVAVMQLLEAVQNHRSGNYFESAEWFTWWDSVSPNLTAEMSGGMDAVVIMTIHKAKGLQFPVVIVPFADWSLNTSPALEWIRPGDRIPELPFVLVKNSESVWKSTEWSVISSLEKQRNLFDNMNVLYVALTRPTDRLYVISAFRKNSVNTWFQKYLSGGESVSESQTRMVAGEPVKRLQDKEKKPGDVSFSVESETNTYSHWSEKLRIAFTAPEALKDESESMEAREAGIRLHEMLQYIRFDKQQSKLGFTPQQWALATSDTLLQQWMRTVEENTEFRNLHAEALYVMNEREWLDDNNEIMRPDRVIVGRDFCYIVDYKTGTERKEHVEKLKYYRETLRMAGYPQPEAYLFYVNYDRLVKVN